jgi:hypothetical protein
MPLSPEQQAALFAAQPALYAGMQFAAITVDLGDGVGRPLAVMFSRRSVFVCVRCNTRCQHVQLVATGEEQIYCPTCQGWREQHRHDLRYQPTAATREPVEARRYRSFTSER